MKVADLKRCCRQLPPSKDYKFRFDTSGQHNCRKCALYGYDCRMFKCVFTREDGKFTSGYYEL